MADLLRIFPKIVSMTLAASCAGGVVLLLRALLKKVPAGYFYALWLLVFVRFLCPFSLEAAFSLIPVRQDAVTYKGLVSTGFQAYRTMTATLPQENVIRRAAAIAGRSGAAPDRLIMGALFCIWLSGVIIILAVAVNSYFRLKKRTACAVILSERSKGRAPVYESEAVEAPFLLGFFRPAIYLPSGMSWEEQIHVLSHENEHFLRRDYLLKPLCFFAVLLHWFNPLVWLYFRLMTGEMERSCDDRVLGKMTAGERAAYARTLLHLGMKSSGIHLLLPTAFGESNTKIRIRHILNFRKPAGWLCAAAVLLVIAAAAVLLTSPAGKEDDPENLANTVPGKEDVLTQEDLAVYLTAGRTPYIGSPFQDQALFGRLPVPEALIYQSMELQTSEEPYELRMIYRLKDDGQLPEDSLWSSSNAVLLFATIENAGRISYIIENGNEKYIRQYERTKMEDFFGPLYEYSEDREKMTGLFEQLETYASEGMPDGLYSGVTGVIMDSGVNYITKEEAQILPSAPPAEESRAESIPDEDSLLMETDRDECTMEDTGLNLTISNQTGQAFYYGDEYRLLIKENGVYREIPLKENVAWTQVLHFIRPGGSAESAIDISIMYDGIVPGEYMIQKVFEEEEEYILQIPIRIVE